MLTALSVNTAHSSKVHATLRHQTPEWYEQIMSAVNEIKSEWIKQYEEEKSKPIGASSSADSTTIHINV
eukprot:3477308-Amphidinium_carterae.1